MTLEGIVMFSVEFLVGIGATCVLVIFFANKLKHRDIPKDNVIFKKQMPLTSKEGKEVPRSGASLVSQNPDNQKTDIEDCMEKKLLEAKKFEKQTFALGHKNEEMAKAAGSYKNDKLRKTIKSIELAKKSFKNGKRNKMAEINM